MSKAAQGFLPACPAVSGEAYFSTSPRQIHAGQEGGNPRRTPLIGKITIYGWKLINILKPDQAVRLNTLLYVPKQFALLWLF